MGKTKPPIYGKGGKNLRGAEPQKLSRPRAKTGTPARVGKEIAMASSIRIETSSTAAAISKNYEGVSFLRDYVKERQMISSHDGVSVEFGGYPTGCYRNVNYAVVDAMKDGGVVKRTIYGTMPKNVLLLSEEDENTIIRENQSRIEESRGGFKGNDDAFLWELHAAITRNVSEILGLSEMKAFTRRSPWIGAERTNIYRMAILPEGRFSAPVEFVPTGFFEEKILEPWLDMESPAAELVTGTEWYGSRSHGSMARIIYSSRLDKGITVFPRINPLNLSYEKVSRLIEERGGPQDCCGRYPLFRGELSELLK